MHTTRSLCAAYYLLALLCPSAAIVGGKSITTDDEFPWYVAVGFVSASGSLHMHCGGTLLSAEHVLTAFHCTCKDFNILSTPTTYRCNDETNSSRPIVIWPRTVVHRRTFDNALPCARIIRSPDNYDLALCELATPLYDSPVAILAMKDAVLPIGSAIRTVGMGTIIPRQYASIYPTQLQTIELMIVKCYANVQYRHLFCATSDCTNDYCGICSGDSGGGVMISTPEGLRLVGVVSWSDCSAEYPKNGFTAIRVGEAWIKSVLA